LQTAPSKACPSSTRPDGRISADIGDARGLARLSCPGFVHKCRRNAQPGELGTTARQLASDTALATGDIHQPQPGGYAGTDMALIDRDEDNRKR